MNKKIRKENRELFYSGQKLVKETFMIEVDAMDVHEKHQYLEYIGKLFEFVRTNRTNERGIFMGFFHRDNSLLEFPLDIMKKTTPQELASYRIKKLE
jgi:hypothetical protein